MSYDIGMFSIQHLQLRLQNVKSVREVARRSGLSEKTLHRIKSGNLNTSIATANKLAAALDAIAPVKTRRAKQSATEAA